MKGIGCLLILAGIVSGVLALLGTPIAGFVVANEWCLPGIAGSFLGGIMLGYGLIRKRKR